MKKWPFIVGGVILVIMIITTSLYIIWVDIEVGLKILLSELISILIILITTRFLYKLFCK